MTDVSIISQTPKSELSEHDVREIGRSTLDVRNRDDIPIYVRVSKTLGRGQDGYFKIDPGQSERWARHVGRRVSIDVSLFGDDNIDATISHLMGISSGDNKFEMNGGRFRQVTRNFDPITPAPDDLFPVRPDSTEEHIVFKLPIRVGMSVTRDREPFDREEARRAQHREAQKRLDNARRELAEHFDALRIRIGEIKFAQIITQSGGSISGGNLNITAGQADEAKVRGYHWLIELGEAIHKNNEKERKEHERQSRELMNDIEVGIRKSDQAERDERAARTA